MIFSSKVCEPSEPNFGKLRSSLDFSINCGSVLPPTELCRCRVVTCCQLNLFGCYLEYTMNPNSRSITADPGRSLQSAHPQDLPTSKMDNPLNLPATFQLPTARAADVVTCTLFHCLYSGYYLLIDSQREVFYSATTKDDIPESFVYLCALGRVLIFCIPVRQLQCSISMSASSAARTPPQSLHLAEPNIPSLHKHSTPEGSSSTMCWCFVSPRPPPEIGKSVH